MNLYFDIGNTNIKLNFNIDDQEYYVNYETKTDYTVDTFYQLLPDQVRNREITNVYICSVVPEKEALLAGMIKKYFKVRPIMIASPLKTGVKIKSNDPSAVGPDLIALSAFLNERDKDRQVIVNMGTATTIVMTENASFEGVIIAPGFKDSHESLIKNASRLSQINIENTDKLIGNNTRDALSIGVLQGHAEMIKALVKRLEPKNVYLSGGHARKFTALLPEYEYIKEATIEGVKSIVRFNHDK